MLKIKFYLPRGLKQHAFVRSYSAKALLMITKGENSRGEVAWVAGVSKKARKGNETATEQKKIRSRGKGWGERMKFLFSPPLLILAHLLPTHPQFFARPGPGALLYSSACSISAAMQDRGEDMCDYLYQSRKLHSTLSEIASLHLFLTHNFSVLIAK